MIIVDPLKHFSHRLFLIAPLPIVWKHLGCMTGLYRSYHDRMRNPKNLRYPFGIEINALGHVVSVAPGRRPVCYHPITV